MTAAHKGSQPGSGAALFFAARRRDHSGIASKRDFFSMFTRVCKAETLAEGGMRLVIADSQLIILAWPEDGEIKAFQGVCPHTNIPLNEADFDGTVLTCPVHFWKWDLNSGAPVDPQESALAAYPVKVEDGVVYIDTDGIAPLFAAP